MVSRTATRAVAVTALTVLAAVAGAGTVATAAVGPGATAPDSTDADAAVDSGGGPFWYGQRLSVRDPGAAGETYELRVETDEARNVTVPAAEVRLGADGAGVVRTSTIPAARLPGDILLTTSDGTPLSVADGTVTGVAAGVDGAEFEVVDQSVALGFSAARVDPEDNLTASIESNRAGFEAVVAADAPDASLVDFLAPLDATDVDADGDGTVGDDDGVQVSVASTDAERRLDPSELPPGSYTFTLEVVDARASASAPLRRNRSTGVLVRFDDQRLDGDNVTVRRVVLPVDGFVVVHDASLLTGAVFDSVVGVSEPLRAGERLDLTVTLEDPPAESGTLIVRPYRDTDGDRIFEFVTSAGRTDGPFLAANGTAVVADEARVRVPGAAPPPVVGTDRPTDPDGDGLYEDVDGDGSFTVFDVQAFLDAYRDEAVQGAAGAFDFTGDGAVDVFDVQALLDELS